MKNFHLPLPEETYISLKAEATRAGLPATTIAREAIDSWLRQQARNARHNAIVNYAKEMAGTDLDLNKDLESAGIERFRSHPPYRSSSGDQPSYLCRVAQLAFPRRASLFVTR